MVACIGLIVGSIAVLAFFTEMVPGSGHHHPHPAPFPFHPVPHHGPHHGFHVEPHVFDFRGRGGALVTSSARPHIFKEERESLRMRGSGQDFAHGGNQVEAEGKPQAELAASGSMAKGIALGVKAKPREKASAAGEETRADATAMVAKEASEATGTQAGEVTPGRTTAVDTKAPGTTDTVVI